MKKLNLNNTHNGHAFIWVVLAVLMFVCDGWSRDCSWQRCYGGAGAQCAPTSWDGCPSSCSYEPNKAYGNCNSAVEVRWGDKAACGYNTSGYTLFHYIDGLFCDDQCAADSVSCVNAGNVWQDDLSASCGKSCKINHCKAADTTWLSTSIAACAGVNNYAIVNTDSTCEHVGACCGGLDSIPEGNSCKWRCDSVLTQCNGRAGTLFGDVLPDTSVSGQDTTFSYQCFYNCAHSPNPDSSVYLVEGNIVLSGPSDSIPDGIKSQSTFNSVRTTTGGVYVYDYLSPAASEYVDSIAAMKCVEHLWRCVINNKYVYWYDNQEVPAGCTNIVRVK